MNKVNRPLYTFTTLRAKIILMKAAGERLQIHPVRILRSIIEENESWRHYTLGPMPILRVN